MKTVVTILLVLSTLCLSAQFNQKTKSTDDKLSEFNVEKPPKLDLKWHEVMNAKKEPSLTSSFDLIDRLNINSRIPSGNEYWIGKTTNYYSEDGKFKATYTYDLQGNVRNSSFSISLKKKD